MGAWAAVASWRGRGCAASAAGRGWTRSKPSCSAAQACADSASSPPAWNSSTASTRWTRPHWRRSRPPAAC
ncbi:hypothetical protein G6F63_017008 [Rhizopus arrhizus]|nr:hypothetical protein G6F63_017008 [Rhizopus arrhizus]